MTSPMLGQRLGSFRSSPAALARVAIFLSTCIGVLVFFVSLRRECPILRSIEFGLLGVASSLIGIGVILSVAWAVSEVRVFENGIEGYSFSGRRHTLTWDSVLSATSRRVVGLRYIVVRSKAHEPNLWIPEFLSDRQRFASLLASQAGRDHPLALATSDPK